MSTAGRVFGTLLALAGCLLIWQAIATYHGQALAYLWPWLNLNPPVPDWSYLSSPAEVLGASSDEVSTGRLFQAVAETAWHTFLAVTIAYVMGILFAEWLKGESRVALAFRPIFGGLNGIPPVTLLPIALIAFGLGSNSVIAIACYGAFLSVLFIALRGFQEVQGDLEISIAHMGYSPFGTWLWRMSAASSQLSTAAREGLRWALILSVVAEMHGAIAGGLGSYIDSARLNQNYATVYVGIIACGLLSVLMQLSIEVIARRIHRLLITSLLGRFS